MTSIKVMGIELKFFAIFAVLVLTLTFFGKLPLGMAGAVPLLMVVGAILGYIGDRMPIIKDYFGGGAIVILFGSASLVLFQVLPKPAIETVSYFMNRTGFLDFALATLITGSLFGTDRKTLLAACLRYVPAIIAAQIVGLIAVAAVGALIGYGWKEAILYIGLPAMGGGIAAGAIPMSKMFGEAMKQDPKTIFSTMVSAVALANAMAILGGGLMDRLGKIKPEWTGNGQLLAVKSDKIHLNAKIIAVADVFNAMTAPKAYGRRSTPYEAAEVMRHEMVGKLDVEICSIFLEKLCQRVLGTVVQLTDGSRGEVVFVNPFDSTRPVVRTPEGEFIDLDKRRDLHISKILHS